jgi:hypothetical protein
MLGLADLSGQLLDDNLIPDLLLFFDPIPLLVLSVDTSMVSLVEVWH